jgi:hypothetical protein
MSYPLCYLQLYTVVYGSTPFYTTAFAVDPQPKTVLAMDCLYRPQLLTDDANDNLLQPTLQWFTVNCCPESVLAAN